MLKEYQITNFKAFADPANIPIKPITLIFGANSSGKSCILQSLLMLKQTLQERRDPNIPLLPKGNSVDLGSFSEFIFDHDINRSFSFKMVLPFSCIDEAYRDSEYSYLMDTIGQHPNVSILEESIKPGPVGLSVTFSLDSKSFNIFVSRIDLYLGDDPKPIATYEIEEKDDQVSNIYNFKGNFDHKYWFTYWKCFDEGNPEGLKRKKEYHDKNLWSDLLAELIKKVPVEKRGDFIKEFEKIKEVSKGKKEKEEYKKSKEGLKKVTGFEMAIEIYKSLFSPTTLSVEGFLPKLLNKNEMKHILYDYDFAYWDSRNVSLFSLTAANLIKVFLDNIEFIAPLREYPERFYTYGGHPLQYVGSSGEKVFDVLFNNSELLTKVNEEFKRLGADYKLRLSRLSREGTETMESFVPQLVNESTGVAASFRDVGFGFSQILPVIVQSTLSKEKTILIEQPELHLHPALQAELGDLFIKSALGEQKNNLIIETHSEHLLLRIMRRMRETAEGELKEVPPVTPNDVCILYVDQPKDKDYSVVYEMRLDKDGALLDPWPGGFFEEGFKERFL